MNHSIVIVSCVLLTAIVYLTAYCMYEAEPVQMKTLFFSFRNRFSSLRYVVDAGAYVNGSFFINSQDNWDQLLITVNETKKYTLTSISTWYENINKSSAITIKSTFVPI